MARLNETYDKRCNLDRNFANNLNNRIKNKFELLKEMNKDNVGIVLVSEFKLDETFSVGQFCIKSLLSRKKFAQ